MRKARDTPALPAREQRPDYYAFATECQAVYALRYTAPTGEVDVDDEGEEFDTLVYVGASRDAVAEARTKAIRKENKTLARLTRKKWKVEVLFVDKGLPIGSEDAATVTMRLHYRSDPRARVLGGVTAALAGKEYAFARACFEQAADNSALGGCLKCLYKASAAERVTNWTRCACSSPPPGPPAQQAYNAARGATLLQHRCAELDAKVQQLEAQRGQAVASAVGQPAGANPVQPARAPILKRPAQAAAPARAKAKRRKGSLQRCEAVKSVLVCGELYTTLAWYLGRKQTQTEGDLARECSLSRDAVRLVGGDSKTLTAFVSDSAHGRKELFPAVVTSVPARATATLCTAGRKGVGKVKARRPTSAKEQNVLWRVGALDSLGSALLA